LRRKVIGDSGRCQSTRGAAVPTDRSALAAPLPIPTIPLGTSASSGRAQRPVFRTVVPMVPLLQSRAQERRPASPRSIRRPSQSRRPVRPVSSTSTAAPPDSGP